MRNIQISLEDYYKLLTLEYGDNVVITDGKVDVTTGLVVGVYTPGYPIIECTVGAMNDDGWFTLMTNDEFTEGCDNLIADIERRLRPIAVCEPVSTPVTPGHYRGNKIETIDVMEQVAANMLDTDWAGRDIVNMSNVIKYCLRFTDKNGVEDLKKARNYLNRVIEGEWYE